VRVAIVGATGQLGSEFVDLQGYNGVEIIPLTHDDFDVRDAGRATNVICSLGKLDAVVNCSVCHSKTDTALANDTNALGALNVAQACKEAQGKPGCLYISSDFVFGGPEDPLRGHSWDDERFPCGGCYGDSKAWGEILTLSCSEKNWVVRVSYLFGRHECRGKGMNIVDDFARRLSKYGTVSAWNNTAFCLAPAKDAAIAILKKMSDAASPMRRIEHVTCSEPISHYMLATFIAHEIGLPLDSVVSKERDPGLYTEIMPTCPLGDWKEAVRSYLEERGYSKESRG
jgi:dTDP-4-dehydrorhamnose reductase